MVLFFLAALMISSVYGRPTGKFLNALPAGQTRSATRPFSDTGRGETHALWKHLEQLTIAPFKKDTFKIEQYGAVPDGVTLNTKAIQKAIDACHLHGGGVVLIPAGFWLTGPLILRSEVNLHIAADGLLQMTGDFDQYPLVVTNYEGLKAVRCQAPISAKDQQHIAITGKGIIDGSGDSWRMVKRSKLTDAQWKTLVASGGLVDKAGNTWYPSAKSLRGSLAKHPGVLTDGKTPEDYQDIKDFLRPNLLSLTACKDVLLEGVTFQNSPAWCLHPLLCEGMVIRDVYAKNPWYAQNGDGLDLESCKEVLIESSSFDVGDDGICMKSGRDEQGRKRNAPTADVLIQHCTVYHAHGGFVIGSEMSGGVKNINVRHCTFIGTDVGLRFKTTRGRGGIVEHIFVSDIYMQHIKGDAIRFDMYYAAQDPVPLPGEKRVDPKEQRFPVTEATPRFRRFFIRNIVCNGADHALFFRGLPEMAIQEITLQNLTMKTRRSIQLTEADHIDISGLKLITSEQYPVTLKNVRHLSLQHVSASKDGLDITGPASANIQLSQCLFGGQSRPSVHFSEGATQQAIQIN